MKSIQKVIVSIDFGSQELQVGELIKEGRGIYFKYYTEFIKTGFELSPFHLPLNDSIYKAPAQPFEGLFGVFSDSLPDGWGRLLLDRTLSAKGILLQDITPLQRLSYVGLKGMGALLYRPQIETTAQETLQVELDAIAKEMDLVLQGASSLAIDTLYEMGGSSGGARPKILVGYHPGTQHLIHGIEPMPEGYEHWLIKFPSSNDRTDIAQIEYAYHKIPVINASVNNPHVKYNFNYNPKNVFEYEYLIKNLDNLKNKKLNFSKDKILEYYFMRHMYVDKNWLIDDLEKMIDSVGGYDGQWSYSFYDYWLKNFTENKHNKVIHTIKNFLKSGASAINIKHSGKFKNLLS